MSCHVILGHALHNLSNPKPGHTTGGSGRGARRGGRARSIRIGCQQNCSPRKQRFLVPPKASKKRRLKVSPEARTSEILCKFKLVESKTRTYHGRVGSERPAERSSEVGQDSVPTELFARETKVHRTFRGIEERSLQRLSRNTNKRNPM